MQGLRLALPTHSSMGPSPRRWILVIRSLPRLLSSLTASSDRSFNNLTAMFAISFNTGQVLSVFPYALCTCHFHRIVGVGRGLCGSSSPTPLPKQGHLEQAALPALVQAGFEYLQRSRLHNLSAPPKSLVFLSFSFPSSAKKLRTWEAQGQNLPVNAECCEYVLSLRRCRTGYNLL